MLPVTLLTSSFISVVSVWTEIKLMVILNFNLLKAKIKNKFGSQFPNPSYFLPPTQIKKHFFWLFGHKLF